MWWNRVIAADKLVAVEEMRGFGAGNLSLHVKWLDGGDTWGSLDDSRTRALITEANAWLTGQRSTTVRIEPMAQGSAGEVLGALQRLASLRDRGVLNDQEFEAQKDLILQTCST